MTPQQGKTFVGCWSVVWPVVRSHDSLIDIMERQKFGWMEAFRIQWESTLFIYEHWDSERIVALYVKDIDPSSPDGFCSGS